MLFQIIIVVQKSIEKRRIDIFSNAYFYSISVIWQKIECFKCFLPLTARILIEYFLKQSHPYFSEKMQKKYNFLVKKLNGLFLKDLKNLSWKPRNFIIQFLYPIVYLTLLTISWFSLSHLVKKAINIKLVKRFISFLKFLEFSLSREILVIIK